jgi:anhydro-N-acetylmuramic acid kinase
MQLLDSSKNSFIGIGLMSGTSLDGLDIAICSFSKENNFNPKLIHFETVSWPESLEILLRKCTSVETVQLRELTYLNRKAADFFADSVIDVCNHAGLSLNAIDFIGSHGHTIYHIPSEQSPDNRAATLQLVDADHIATRTGILTVSDFRQKHIAVGGEGAPLVVYGDYALFMSSEENRILVNIGGMANLTWLPVSATINEIKTTDTGPGNKLIDLAVNLMNPNLFFDDKGEFAAKGQIDNLVLETFLNDSFFLKSYPKSTGTEYFNSDWLLRKSKNITDLNRIKTVTALTAISIVRACENFAQNQNYTLYVSGGGAHNNTLIELLKTYAKPNKVRYFDELGFSADSKEGVLFSWLAFQTLAGQSLISPRQSGIKKPITLGKISLPK